MTEVLEVRRAAGRVRARNAIRSERSSVELLPPDVDTKVNALRTLDGESQSLAVTAMLAHARTGLLAAIAAQNLPQIVEFKAKGAAIQEVAKQLRLGKEIQLDSAEFVRRAERGLGVAIREGQANGTVETTSEGKGRARRNDLNGIEIKPKPTDFAGPHELSGADRNDFGIYGMTDGISEVQFEEALAEAKAEAKLSRANVARKAKAKAKILDPAPVQEQAAPEQLKGKVHGPRPNHLRILRNLTTSLSGLATAADDIRELNDSVTSEEAGRLASDLSKSIRSLNRIKSQLQERSS